MHGINRATLRFKKCISCTIAALLSTKWQDPAFLNASLYTNKNVQPLQSLVLVTITVTTKTVVSNRRTELGLVKDCDKIRKKLYLKDNITHSVKCGLICCTSFLSDFSFIFTTLHLLRPSQLHEKRSINHIMCVHSESKLNIHSFPSWMVSSSEYAYSKYFSIYSLVLFFILFYYLVNILCSYSFCCFVLFRV